MVFPVLFSPESDLWNGFPGKQKEIPSIESYPSETAGVKSFYNPQLNSLFEASNTQFTSTATVISFGCCRRAQRRHSNSAYGSISMRRTTDAWFEQIQVEAWNSVLTKSMNDDALDDSTAASSVTRTIMLTAGRQSSVPDCTQSVNHNCSERMTLKRVVGSQPRDRSTWLRRQENKWSFAPAASSKYQ